MITGESLALRLDPNDNVAIARHALSRGRVLSEYAGVVVGADIPAAHKVAIADIEQSEPVRRYGQTLDAIHEVFTDAAPPAPEAQRLRESDVVLHIAEAA